MYYFLLVWLVPLAFILVFIEEKKRREKTIEKTREVMEKREYQDFTNSMRELLIMMTPKQGFGKNEVPVETPPEDDKELYQYFHNSFLSKRQQFAPTLRKILPLIIIPIPIVIIVFCAYIFIADLDKVYFAILLPPIIVIGAFCYYMIRKAIERSEEDSENTPSD